MGTTGTSSASPTVAIARSGSYWMSRAMSLSCTTGSMLRWMACAQKCVTRFLYTPSGTGWKIRTSYDSERVASNTASVVVLLRHMAMNVFFRVVSAMHRIM